MLGTLTLKGLNIASGLASVANWRRFITGVWRYVLHRTVPTTPGVFDLDKWARDIEIGGTYQGSAVTPQFIINLLYADSERVQKFPSMIRPTMSDIFRFMDTGKRIEDFKAVPVEPQQIIKEIPVIREVPVIHEIPVERIITKEVMVTVPVEKIVEKEKIVIPTWAYVAGGGALLLLVTSFLKKSPRKTKNRKN